MTKKEIILGRVKYGYKIKDPFPERTEYTRTKSLYDNMKSILGIKSVDVLPKPKDVNPYEAFRMGQQDVYERLEKVLSEILHD